MEQNILPKKIKIAAFLMLATGILVLVQFVFIIAITKIAWSQMDASQYSIFSVILTNLEKLVIGILFIVFAYFLKKRKKWAWFATMVILLKEAVAGIKSALLLFYMLQTMESQLVLLEYLSPLLLPLFLVVIIISVLGYVLILISLIFLISERKNYWHI